MNGRKKGRELRRKLRATGRVDFELAAHVLDLRIEPWPFPSDEVHEAKVGRWIGVAEGRSEQERRWDVAHAIGHHVLHPGNQLWLRSQTLLAEPNERQAEDFAYGLLVDEAEALGEGLTEAWQLAEYFGVPEAMVRVQGRLL